MELDITFLEDENNIDLMDYSASAMELGENAGPITWENSKNAGFEFVKTEAEIEEAKDYIGDFGAWSDEEISGWSNTELNALILQFIAGDLREFLDAEKWEPEEYKKWEENCGGRIYRSEGKLYYTLSN